MNNQPPRLLVTGLSGMVGSRFQQLFNDQYDWMNLDLTNGVDITNADSVEKIFAEAPAVAVIHLAAFTNVSGAFEQQGDVHGSCYMVNVLGTKTIAQAAARHHVHMIHISTDYVFDGTKQEPYTETDAVHPIEWYGQTKYLAEAEVEQSGAASVILRLAFPYQTHPMRPDFLHKIIDHLKQNTLPPAFSDHFITPTFVDDVAHVLHYCVQNKPTGLYHMVGSSSHSDFEIAQMVKDVFQLSGEVREGSLAAYLETIQRPYQQTMRVSNHKLTAEFGLSMKTLSEGLEEVKRQMTV